LHFVLADGATGKSRYRFGRPGFIAIISFHCHQIWLILNAP
jgi:hypothetical protein